MQPDYFSIRHAESLEPASTTDNHLAILGAVYLGNTRLIDNVTLTSG
jgi:pantoate--beta-alanine ligase